MSLKQFARLLILGGLSTFAFGVGICVQASRMRPSIYTDADGESRSYVAMQGEFCLMAGAIVTFASWHYLFMLPWDKRKK
jgi:hypothetical protein